MPEARTTQGRLQSSQPVSATFAKALAELGHREETMLLRQGAGTSRGGEEELPGGSRGHDDGLECQTGIGEGLPSPGKREPKAELKKRHKAVNAEI